MALGSLPAAKRQRAERRASTALMALADLYRGVAKSTPSVNVIAATMGAVVVNNNGGSGAASVAALKDAPPPASVAASSLVPPPPPTVRALSV